MQTKQPPQHQGRQPGRQEEMRPEPAVALESWSKRPLLQGRVVLITGGDSGIGRSVAVACAKEGADVAIVYRDEHDDAAETSRLIQSEKARAVAIAGDVGDESFCVEAVGETVGELGKLDILVNNAGEQHVTQSIEEITADQLEATFRTNVFSMFYMTKAALRHLHEGSSIINTTSITAYKGHSVLVDYSATKGAIVSFTRSLSQQLVKRGIRVNAVAPGPTWTPLIPATYDADRVAQFGNETPMGRPGQPAEVAPAYVYLASALSSYMTGQTLHINGGTIVNG